MGSCFGSTSKPDIPVPVQEQVPIVLSQDDRLLALSEGVKETSVEGLFLKARVLSVYDGDTYTIAFFPPWHKEDSPFVGKFRMFGFDAPEIKPRLTEKNRDFQIASAERVRDLVKKKIGNKIVWIQFSKNEKFGRLMGLLYFDESKKDCLNDWIVKNRLGKGYHGEKKPEWTREELEYIMFFDE
jgi:endonuclease YncB( thermonuclease family)